METRIRRKEFQALRKLPLLAVPLAILGFVLWVSCLRERRIPTEEDYNHAIRFRSPEIVHLQISAKDPQEAREKVGQACRKLVIRHNGLYEVDPEGIHLKARHDSDPTWFSDYYITNPQPYPNQKTWIVEFRNVAVTSTRNRTRTDAAGAIEKNQEIRDLLKEHLALVGKSVSQ